MSTTPRSTSVPRTITAILVALTMGDLPLTASTLCGAGVPLEPGTTWRDPGSPNGFTCFEVNLDETDFDTTDLVVVELLQPAGAPHAHIVLSSAPSRHQVLMHTATTLVLSANIGTYHLGVATDDPTHPLASFRLDVSRASALTKDEDDTELEIEPDRQASSAPHTKDEDDTELEIEPDFQTTVETTHSDLSALTNHPFFVASHQDPTNDDHGDTFLRATPLTFGQTAMGDTTNDWGDDVDAFRFDVERVGPVVIEVDSEAAVDVALFDRHGLRIEYATGVEAGAQIVRTLVPGRYFVNVQSRSGAIRYALRASTTPNAQQKQLNAAVAAP